MKYLCNIYNPGKEDAQYRVVKCLSGETQEEAWQRQLVWLADKVLGEPVATETMTAQQLREIGMVGVYSQD